MYGRRVGIRSALDDQDQLFDDHASIWLCYQAREQYYKLLEPVLTDDLYNPNSDSEIAIWLNKAVK